MIDEAQRTQSDTFSLPQLGYIIGTYPRLTTTFIDREIESLRKQGAHIDIISIRYPDDAHLFTESQVGLQRDITYLLPIKWRILLLSHLLFVLTRFTTYFGTLLYLVSRPHPGLKARLKTILHFAEGVYAAYFFRRLSSEHIHAHFVDRAATVALVASRLLKLPYSVTAHAGNDIFVDPVLLPEKLAEAEFTFTCTAHNKEHLKQYGNGLFNHKLFCIYHGLDASRYQRRERDPHERPVLLAVGQLTKRKGLGYLLEACRVLVDKGYNIDCHIVGGGPLRPTLEAQTAELGLTEQVVFHGALPHDDVIERFRQADIFVLPAVEVPNGGRDGIPNVILEAMAMEVPVISTDHSGIPEVVKHQVNGMLVPPRDTAQLVAALQHLLDNPDERERLGREGRRTVLKHFDVDRNARRLLEVFKDAARAQPAAV